MCIRDSIKGVFLLLFPAFLSSCSALRDDNNSKFADFSQITHQASKLNGQKIAIRGYLSRNSAEEKQLVLVSRVEDFQTEPDQETRLYINAEDDISACYGEFVALAGSFRIDDYGIKWLDVDYAHALITVEPLVERRLVVTDHDKQIGSVGCGG